jgi:hypothetical protein
MKKIAALVTTLILGASTVALAAPNAPYARDHRAPYTQFRPQLPSWTMLSSNASLARGKDKIAVSSSARFTKLKLEASRGSMFIDKVVITFANGERQVVNLDKTIGARTGATTIDLQGRARQISKIVVSGKGGFRAGYSLAAV